MIKIIISPYSRLLRNGNPNPKNYPYWKELVRGLKQSNCFIIQIGNVGEIPIEGIDDFRVGLSLHDLTYLVLSCYTWISVDNFFQHLCHLIPKPGYVIFGQSDPLIFGHPENTNLLKDRKYLRKKQFDIWEAASLENDSFLTPEEILSQLKF